MRYPASEKAEIIQLVEQSRLCENTFNDMILLRFGRRI
jgi:hypothetical protein